MDRFLNLLTLEKVTEEIKKAYQKYKKANSSFWVTSLSFYTITAIVPLAAIVFSLGSWFGAKDYLIDKLASSTPLPKEVIAMISNFAENLLENARGGVLAGIGFIFLGWTFIKMFSLIENSFNDIWHIKTPRKFVRKISDYISFFIFLPLIFILLNGGIIIVMNKVQNISILFYIFSKIVPYLSVLLFFALLYIIMPNTNVRIVPAIFSAFIISVMYSIFQFIFIHLQIFIKSYSIVYGSFSVIFIFLFWIKIFWFFVILGVHLSYLFQNASLDISLDSDTGAVSFYSKLYIALKVLEELVQRYINNRNVATFDDLRKIIKTSTFLLENVLEELSQKGYIVCGVNLNNEKIFSIAKNIEQVKLKEIYNIMAKSGEEIYILKDDSIDEIEKIILNEDYNRTLRSLGGK